MRLKNEWINGDCLKELKKMDAESIDLIITSPPYHNLRVYSNDPSDLSNCESYEEYYYLLGLVIAECERVLKPGGKFVMQFEDYNYTVGRDNKMGQESLTGDINKTIPLLLSTFSNLPLKIWNSVKRFSFNSPQSSITPASHNCPIPVPATHKSRI